MNKQTLFYVLSILLFLEASAQSDVDALRLSLPQNTGTARNMGLGNTMGSIGADISVLNTNPAGLAKITATEFALTPAFSIFNSNSDYIGETMEDSKFKFHLHNFGVAFIPRSLRAGEGSDWSGAKLGFSYNRLANLNQQFFISGYNDKNSLADNYFETLRDNTGSTYEAENNFPFGASLAYLTDLVYFDTSDVRYYTSINGNVRQDIRIQRKGGLDEGSLGIASGFKEKLFIGVSLGIPVLNYTDNTLHKETDVNDSSFSFNYFEQDFTYRTTGVGLNLKVGLLAQPHKSVRLSMAFHTPGIIFAKDVFQASINADYDTYTAEAISPDGQINYKIRLPWRMLTGVSYIHKYGLLAVEYELSDAGGAKYKFKDATTDIVLYEQDLNNTIGAKYQLYHTIKIGTEIKIDPVRLRAGFQYRSTPFQPDFEPADDKSNTLTYSGGIGYRGKNWYMDAAYQFTKASEIYVPYTLGSEAVPYATLKSKRSTIAFTVGYRIGG
jgi:hypothetical protein